MQIGLIGLGKMGANMRDRIIAGGHEVVGYDTNPEISDVATVEDLVKALTPPRVVWLMVPAGRITQSLVDQLGGLLEKGDLVIDGGNSKFTDDAVHAVSGPAGRHAALIEDAFKVLIEAPGGGVSINGGTRDRSDARRVVEDLAKRAALGAEVTEADVRAALGLARGGKGTPGMAAARMRAIGPIRRRSRRPTATTTRSTQTAATAG